MVSKQNKLIFFGLLTGFVLLEITSFGIITTPFVDSLVKYNSQLRKYHPDKSQNFNEDDNLNEILGSDRNDNTNSPQTKKGSSQINPKEIILYKNSDGVTFELDGQTFKKSISKFGCWIINFYRPDSENCTEFRSNFSELAKIVNKTKPYNFGFVNCMTDSRVCAEETIYSVPVVVLYHSGYRNILSNGSIILSSDSFVKWVDDILKEEDNVIG